MSQAQKTDVVEYVFKRLAATYGAAWDRSLGQSPIVDVMTVWGHQLQPFTGSDAAKKMVVWALDNLPDRAPNVLEFKALCRRAPSATPLALPEPKPDPARIEAELAKLAPLRARVGVVENVDHKAWAKRIIARKSRGERINTTAHRMACDALGLTT